MFRKVFVAARAMSLAMLALLLTAGWSYGQPAGAQGTGWITGGSQVTRSAGGSGGYSYSARSNYTAPRTYAAPVTATASVPTATGYQSFYPPEAGSADRAVSLNVAVPASAQLWVGGVKTQPTGTHRRFVSPRIEPGRDYTYDIRVAWIKDGKAVSQSRHITVHAGDVINLTFDAQR